MKKIMIVLAGFVFLAACNNPNPGETGVVDDGIKPIDENGALSDADSIDSFNPSIDTAIGDDRVGTELRDTSTYKWRDKDQ